MRRHHLILPVVAALLALAGCSRSDKKSQKTAGPVPVLAAKAVTTNMPVRISAIGNVAPFTRVSVRSQVTGQLQKTHFKEGEEVRQGDLLFTIDPRPLQAALSQARASLARDTAQAENARIQFTREEKLLAQKVASQEEYDSAKASYEALVGTVAADQAVVSNAVLNLEYTQIRAPVDAVAGAQQVYPGNIVKSPDDEMVVLNQIHPVQVSFAVPEYHLAEIKRQSGDHSIPVTATFTGLTGAAPTGELTFVDNAVNQQTGTIQLKATFSNEDDRLWPGQFVQVELTVSEITNAIVVPSQAVQTGQNGEYVFTVKPDQSAEMRPVKVGENSEGLTMIASGLKAGEIVVTDGQLRIVPNAKVVVKTSLATAGGTNAAAGAGQDDGTP